VNTDSSGIQLIDADTGLNFPPLQTADPDAIAGTLGNLRDVLGLNFKTQDFVNSVGDEQNLSNFRILSDYITSLAQSWINNLPFFGLDSRQPFFGTQLVLLSRQLSVVAESVDEVRFTLDSVFIGPAERQATKLNYLASTLLSPIFVEDLLSWVRNFATEEGPNLIQNGGKFGVQNTFTPVVRQLLSYIANLPSGLDPSSPLPAGFSAYAAGNGPGTLPDAAWWSSSDLVGSDKRHIVFLEWTETLNRLDRLFD